MGRDRRKIAIKPKDFELDNDQFSAFSTEDNRLDVLVFNLEVHQLHGQKDIGAGPKATLLLKYS